MHPDGRCQEGHGQSIRQTKPPDLSRYVKQTVFRPFGVEGQERLVKSSVLVVGIGGLGSWVAELLVRAGVGRIRLDSDGRGIRFVTLSHNTIRGAAGQSILNAEVAAIRGLLPVGLTSVEDNLKMR